MRDIMRTAVKEKTEFKKGDKYKIMPHHYWHSNPIPGEKPYEVEIVIPEVTSVGQIYVSMYGSSPFYVFANNLFK